MTIFYLNDDDCPSCARGPFSECGHKYVCRRSTEDRSKPDMYAERINKINDAIKTND